MRMKTNRGGEIVQVHGGPILRSTGRKDRDSKVYTAKGPRDRRVRLAAITAIQFYDVQDRLGYDRPSKAVDWLINKAKNAIDKLEELPPWNANDPFDHTLIADPNLKDLAQQLEPSSYGYLFQQLGQNPSCSSSPFSLQSVNVQSIEDTLKLFVPTSSMNFQNYPSVETGDLCLSLQSLQDPNSSHNSATNQGIFSGSAPTTFSASFPRMLDWNGEGRVEFISELSQRETFQSSFSNLIRAWDDHPPPLPAGDRRNSPVAHHSPVSRSQFSPEGFSGFQAPARFLGEEEIGTGSGNPSSVSLDSHS